MAMLNTLPEAGAGISIEALSDSNTMMESPSETSSPTATHTSITSTFSAPPISGTLTGSSAAAAAGAGAGAVSTGAASAGAESPAASVSSSNMAVPSETWSPSLIRMLTTLPATGDGTSIEALSDSKTIKESSCATVSPTATHTSITSTFSEPPISGNLMVSIATVESP